MSFLETRSLMRVSPTAKILDPHLSIFLKPEMISIGDHSRLDGLIKIEGGRGVTIGEHVHIASFSHINAGGGKVVFEDHSGCATHTVVAAGSPDWSYLYISAAEPDRDRHTLRYLTRICAYAFIAAGCTIVPGVTIGEGAVVKPGSVVYDDVEPWTIVQGNPAVKVGLRTIKTSMTKVSMNGKHL